MELRRVVITGTGMVSPLATGVEETWKRLLEGQNAAAPIDDFDVSDLPCKIAAPVRRGDGSDATFDPAAWMDKRDLRRVDDFIVYAMAGAEMALEEAGWRPKDMDDEEGQHRTGVLIGSGIGGFQGIADGAITLAEKGPRKLSPFFISGRLINLASGYVSIAHKLKGPNHAVVTACSTGAHAVGDAARLIALGDADVMVAGGSESARTRLSIAGFAACKALTTGFNETPEKASRPYDKARDGFLMGEGSGVLVLEELEHARARGARIIAEVVGYGLSGDAYHVTAPASDGNGAYRAMQAAVKRAGIDVSQIDYMNAHATSTPLGDEIELKAVTDLVGAGSGLSMSSTKSAIGHLLGAAGAVEAIFTALAIRDNVVPPTLNLDDPSVETDIDLVPHHAKARRVDVAMSNSFGFGGTNASLVLRRYAD